MARKKSSIRLMWMWLAGVVLAVISYLIVFGDDWRDLTDRDDRLLALQQGPVGQVSFRAQPPQQGLATTFPAQVFIDAGRVVTTAVPAAPKTRRANAVRYYLTYERFPGQLNNQLFQLAVGLQHAEILERTLIVPPEIREQDFTGMFVPEAQIWDLDPLTRSFDVELYDAKKHAELLSDSMVNSGGNCYVLPSQFQDLLQNKRTRNEFSPKRCPLLNLGGKGGLLMCGQNRFCGNATEERIAYKVYGTLRLHSRLMERLPSERFPVSVHSRSHGIDRRTGNGVMKICTDGVLKTLSAHVRAPSVAFQDVMTSQCALWERGALDKQLGRQPANARERYPLTFLLCDDEAHDWNSSFWAGVRRVKGLPPAGNSLLQHRREGHYSFTVEDIDRVSKAMLDMWALAGADYFVGNLYSTFSLTVCMLRGENRKWGSNVCSVLMHPGQNIINSPTLLFNGSLESASFSAQQEAGVLPSDRKQVDSHMWTLIDAGGMTTRLPIKPDVPAYVIVDVYFVQLPEKQRGYAIVGEGVLPGLSFPTPHVYKVDLQCLWDRGEPTDAELFFMRQQDGSIEYKRIATHRFSDNGDVFRTFYILCREKAAADARFQGLKRQSPEGYIWKVPKERLEHLWMRPRPAEKNTHRLTICLAPVYAGENMRWFIEWVEYHKILGVTHVHLPIFEDEAQSPMLWAVARHYEAEGFATLHDWSPAHTGDVTSRMYERGKMLAWSTCFMESRGRTEWLAFIDIDEVIVPPQSGMRKGLQNLRYMYTQSRGSNLGFTMKSITVVSILDLAIPSYFESGKLLLDEYHQVEDEPLCPYNCGKYHRGRQKYILRALETSLPLSIPWTHAVSRDYEYSEKVMTHLPEDSFHVRHYQAWWYMKDGAKIPEADVRRELPINRFHLDAIQRSIEGDSMLQSFYRHSPAKNGVTWAPGYAVPRRKAKVGPGLPPHECNDAQKGAQLRRWVERDKEWWSHTACPAQYWLDNLRGVFEDQNRKVLNLVDIGCNKGYTSAGYMDLFAPSLGLNPKTIFEAASNVLQRQMATVPANLCGACGDCNHKLGLGRPDSSARVVVHCFEPSPSTMSMLRQVHNEFTKRKKSPHEWILHEVGMSNGLGEIWWDKSCNTTGNELCKIVPKGTPGAIRVHTESVDSFMRENPQVKHLDILKIDAEGHDPHVLAGATELLSNGSATVVTFEYNPGVGGLWEGITLRETVDKLDEFGYDCYFDSNPIKNGGVHDASTTPSLYLISGGCLPDGAARRFRGWSNVVCALRADSDVASMFRGLATLLQGTDNNAEIASTSSPVSWADWPRPRVVYGIHTSRNEKRYAPKLRAQFSTWAKDIPRNHFFVRGPRCPDCKRNDPRRIWEPTNCDEHEKLCKALAHMRQAHDNIDRLNWDWLFAMNEDQYVNEANLVRALKKEDPSKPVVLSGFGCGRHWKYDPRSKNGTVPKPGSYIEHDHRTNAVCEFVQRNGAICGGEGIAYSRAAIQKIFAHPLNTSWMHPSTQVDPAVTCLISDAGVPINVYQWHTGFKTEPLKVFPSAAVYHLSDSDAIFVEDYMKRLHRGYERMNKVKGKKG